MSPEEIARRASDLATDIERDPTLTNGDDLRGLLHELAVLVHALAERQAGVSRGKK